MKMSEIISPNPSAFEVVGPKWRKKCPPSVVLFGTDGRGQACVIDHQGPDAAYLLEVDADVFVEEELATWVFPGLWVWEGKIRTSVSWAGEHDAWPEGEIRPLTENEARSIRKNTAIWDQTLWIEPS